MLAPYPRTWLQILAYYVMTRLTMAVMARALNRFITASSSKNIIHRVKLSQASSKLPVLTLFTKEDCQLCEEALEELGPFLHKVVLREVDIEEDGREEEYNKFKYEIPVFFLNNKFLCKNRIDLIKFHNAMDAINTSDQWFDELVSSDLGGNVIHSLTINLFSEDI